MLHFSVTLRIFMLCLALISCSFQVLHGKVDDIQPSSRETSEMASRLLFEIKIHGFLLWASFGFLVPAGIIVIRMSQREKSSRRIRILVYIHVLLQISSVLLVTVGAVLSFKNFENSFTNDHRRIGLGLYVFVWLQVLIGICRSRRGSKGRSIWYLVHWLLGIGISLLGVINIYTGLQAYHSKMTRSPSIWIAVFSAEIALILLIYLFQEKWEYIRKQGVMLGHEPVKPTEQEILPENQGKVTSSQPC